MTNGLVIKSQDACRLADELVSLTGESVEDVLIMALREGVARERARLARQDRIMAITREIAGRSRYSAAALRAMAG